MLVKLLITYLSRCDWLLEDDSLQVTRITSEIKTSLQDDVIDAMASQGLRTMCIAYKDIVPGMVLTCEVRWSARTRYGIDVSCDGLPL